jgi:hypothetical protein
MSVIEFLNFNAEQKPAIVDNGNPGVVRDLNPAYLHDNGSFCREVLKAVTGHKASLPGQCGIPGGCIPVPPSSRLRNVSAN